jgi:hypothetical protein
MSLLPSLFYLSLQKEGSNDFWGKPANKQPILGGYIFQGNPDWYQKRLAIPVDWKRAHKIQRVCNGL